MIGKVLFVALYLLGIGTLWLVARALSRAQDGDG